MGQYTGSQDRLKALFQTEYLYNDLKIDWGELRNFVQISEEEFYSVETDRIAEQSCLKNIKAYPSLKSQDFDGYNLALSEVRALNVQIVRAPQQDLQPFLGDIRFTLYGKINSTEFYTDFLEIEDKKEVVFSPFLDNYPSEYEVREDPPTSLRPSNSGCLSGCFSTIGMVFAIIPLIGLLLIFLSIGWIPTLLIFAILGLIWLLNRFPALGNYVGRNLGCLPRIFTGIFSVGFFLLIGWALLSMIMKGCGNGSSNGTFQPPTPVIEETENLQKEKIIRTKDDEFSDNYDVPEAVYDTLNSEKNEPIFDTLIINNRVWKDYQDNIHRMDIVLSKRDIRISRNNRNQNYLNNGYSGLYQDLSIFNDALLERVYGSLDSLRLANKMDEKTFAEAIVSMIQDIPYKLILETDCAQGAQQSRFVMEYLSQCSEPCCLGNTKFGLQAPTEFLGNLYGDCDTRTLCLYTILKHFDYDVGIINSKQLSHSMLAINLPYEGVYKSYNNKRYFLWETTNAGFVPGYVPPDYNNMNLWEMELTSK